MSKTTVIYKDVAVGADADASVSAAGSARFSHIDQLPFEITHEPIATLEPNSWVLNGSRVFLDTQRVAFWSENLSDGGGDFKESPTITITFKRQYASLGVSIVADPASGEYCSQLNIKWYHGDLLKADKNFSPNGPCYFCSNRVEVYDKIVITINKTSKPQRRAKIDQIVFGVIREFGVDEIRKARIINQNSLSAMELPVSTFQWTLDSLENIDFLFQFKQPIEVRNNDNLIGVYYVDKSDQKGKHLYNIQSNDAIGVLDGSNFPGGDYTAGVMAKKLMADIVGGTFQIDFTDVQDKKLYGILQNMTKREAIQQVILAWGVVLSTDGTHKLNVYNPPSTLKDIDPNRVFPGVSVKKDAIVTEVVVTAHKYTKNGDNYDDKTTEYRVKNPDVVASEKENVVTVGSATLVSDDNAQDVARRIYDYYAKRNKGKAKIVLDGETLGDLISIPNQWGEENSGNIEKMELTLSNTVVAAVETVG